MDNKIRMLVGCLLLFTAFTRRLLAEELTPPPTPQPSTSFSIQIPLMRYSDTTSKKTEVGISSSDRTSRLATQPLGGGGAFLSARLDKTVLYLYPFSDFNKIASLGYFVRSDVLLGFDLGLNFLNNNDLKTTSNSSQLGTWVFFFAPIGEFTSETGFIVSNSRFKDRETDNGVTTTTKASEIFVKGTFSLTYSFSNNLRWNFGPYIYQDTYRIDGGSKTTAVQFGFVIANIRFRWS